MKLGWCEFAGALLCVAASVGAQAPQYRYSPAGSYPGAFMTVPLVVKGKYIGGYYESCNAVNGYVERDRQFQNLFPPGSKSLYVSGINRHGVVVGGYCPNGCNPNTGQHGFIYSHGTYAQIDYPSGQSGTTTTAFGINDQGQIVRGYCLPPNPACPTSEFNPADHGFLDDNGSFTQLDYPGAQQTQASAVNDAGVVVGIYSANNTGPHAFLYQNGVYTNIDAPGANITYVGSINNLGVAAGNYQATNFFVYRFPLSKRYLHDHDQRAGSHGDQPERE
jgi:probable HAF family extracellular repeat protein